VKTLIAPRQTAGHPGEHVSGEHVTSITPSAPPLAWSPVWRRRRARAREQELLQLLKQARTTAELSTHTGLSSRHVRTYLSSLQQRSLVEHVREGRNVYWVRVKQRRLPAGRRLQIVREQLERGPKTTDELADALGGLEHANVFHILRPLLDRGEVVRDGTVHRGGRGRPVTRFRLTPPFLSTTTDRRRKP
jgi:predicted ArsR family transcriptional regulator